MAVRRSSRVKVVSSLELALGLALYACAVLALHVYGLHATSPDPSLAAVLPALVIPPLLYVLVGLVSVRPRAPMRILGAAGAMSGLHVLLVAATGALFMIPDLLDYGTALAFALWGSPAVTLLQVIAASLVFVRLRPLLSPSRVPRADARVTTRGRVEPPGGPGAQRPFTSPAVATPFAPATRTVVAPSPASNQREPVVAAPAQIRPPSAVPASTSPTVASSPPSALHRTPVFSGSVGRPTPVSPPAWASASRPPTSPPPMSASQPVPTAPPLPSAPVAAPVAPPVVPHITTPAPVEPTPSAPPVKPALDEAVPVALRSSVATPVEPTPSAPPAKPVLDEAVPVAVPVAPRSSAPAPMEPTRSVPPAKKVLDEAEPMIRIPIVRIGDQLPVGMFARGADGLKDTLRPGVALLVPRKLLLPHLGEGLAPVKWAVVADQFPRDELALSHQEIEARLPGGALLLPLDEVVPQIPPELLALSTPQADTHGIEEFPDPFQPQAPMALKPSVFEAQIEAGTESDSPVADVEDVTDLEETPASAAAADIAEVAEAPERDAAVAEAPPSEVELDEPEHELVAATDAAVADEALPSEVERHEPEHEMVVPAEPSAAPEPPVELEPAMNEAPAVWKPVTNGVGEHGWSEQARRIATMLTPLLKIGQRDGAGTTLMTVVAPTVSEDAVVQTATRVVPFLSDARLPGRVIQATLTAPGTTLVLTPFGSADAGGSLLVTAVASRASLAWFERLSRTVAGQSQGHPGDGRRSAREDNHGSAAALRSASVPAAVLELASSLTAFGPVTPTLLCDEAGALSTYLFLPSALDALPLARFARDVDDALEGAEIGRVGSVILNLGAHRMVLRAIDGASGHVTMLVGVGRIDRPGLARIELERAATRLGDLVRS